jgi:hypothetical protein
MTNPPNLGNGSQLMASIRNVSNSNGSSIDALKLAAVGIALIKESFPTNQAESEQAAELRLELLAELAEQVGEQRFVRAIRDTIKVSHRRWDCSVARVREMAGLRYVPPPSLAAQAWEMVTQVFIDHCRTDANGNYRLEDKIVNVNGAARVFHVPEIPLAIKRAIRSLGGWAAIAEAWPEYIGAKYRDFKELYHEDDSPRVDSGLERV